jgi:Uma2 family endonuclease
MGSGGLAQPEEAMSMPKTSTQIGPLDNGRHMSLEEFDLAEGQPRHLYELSRGVIIVVDVPNRRHLAQVHAMRQQFYLYAAAHPDRIHTIASRGECKLLVVGAESERHPDLAVYTKPPVAEKDLWVNWVPEIVVEVVSSGSKHRDYVERREEYCLFGVREYWIIDAARQEMLVLRRADDDWRERVVRPPKTYRTRVLPGFEFDCSPVFQAGTGN